MGASNWTVAPMYPSVVMGACKRGKAESGTGNLQVSKGFIGNKEVSVLRDTECTSAVARATLVTKGQMLVRGSPVRTMV